MDEGYSIHRLSVLRRAVIASASVTRQKNAIHSFTEIEIEGPLRLIEGYKDATGIKLSFTGYLVACFAKVASMHPEVNSFISRRRIIRIRDIIISVLIERTIMGETVPEPVVISSADRKSLRAITEQIRDAQRKTDAALGSISNASFLRLIPPFLLKAFVRMADKNIKMGIKYGKLAVTSVGMYCAEPVWFVPHGSATVLLTVGSMIERTVMDDAGKASARRHLCLTVSFDHDIIDGAPAARFMDDLIKEIRSGAPIRELS